MSGRMKAIRTTGISGALGAAVQAARNTAVVMSVEASTASASVEGVGDEGERSYVGF